MKIPSWIYWDMGIGLILYVNGVHDGNPWMRYPGLVLFCVGLLRVTERT